MPDIGITPQPPNPNERRVGISRDDYLSLFLEADAFPKPMEMVQDTRLHGPDPDDLAFPRCQGILTGLAAWMAAIDEIIWRVVDIRWVFPTAWQASTYHAQRLRANSEGTAPVETAPEVGEECRVFGGTVEIVAPITLTQYFYLFRVGRVVAKIYVAQGQEVVGAKLSPSDIAPIAARVVARLEA